MNTTILTSRQTEFLQLTAEGLRFQEIAQRCYVALPTVKDTMNEVRLRLGARTLAQAVALAISLEIIVVPVPVSQPCAA